MSSNVKKALIGGGILLVIFAVFFGGDDVKNTESQFKVTAVDMMAEWYENEIKWENKYMGKIGEVSGSIQSIGLDYSKDAYIQLNTGDILWQVKCVFPDSNEIVELSEGDDVTFKGKVHSTSGYIQLEDCQLVK